MLATDQERIIEKFSKWTLGAPCVFEPENHVKLKGKQIEPADLCWVHGNVVIFFHATRMKKKAQAEEKHERQTRRWMNFWRNNSTARLSGQNAFRRFSVPYAASLRVLVLSVLDSAHDEIQSSQAAAQRLSVAGYFSVPENIFEILADAEGTLLDLLDALLGFPLARAIAPKLSLRDWVFLQRNAALGDELATMKLHADTPFIILRNMIQAAASKAVADGLQREGQFASFFNDLRFREHLRINLCVSQLHWSMDRAPRDRAYFAFQDLYAGGVMFRISACNDLSRTELLDRTNLLPTPGGEVLLLWIDGTRWMVIAAHAATEYQQVISTLDQVTVDYGGPVDTMPTATQQAAFT